MCVIWFLQAPLQTHQLVQPNQPVDTELKETTHDDNHFNCLQNYILFNLICNPNHVKIWVIWGQKKPNFLSGLTQLCCNRVASHTDDFLRSDQFTVASHCQVQGHRFTNEGKVSLPGTAKTFLRAGHKTFLTLHVLIETVIQWVLGTLWKKRMEKEQIFYSSHVLTDAECTRHQQRCPVSEGQSSVCYYSVQLEAESGSLLPRERLCAVWQKRKHFYSEIPSDDFVVVISGFYQSSSLVIT